MAKGQEIYDKQLAYLMRGDIDGLLRDQYSDDCELVTFDFVLKGREAIGHYLKVDSPAKSGQILGLKTTHFVATEDCVIFNAIAESEKLGRFIARDVLYIKDDRIHRHIALTLPPEADQALWEISL
ncbi:MAG: hypothetical protein EOM24_31575 [Chloroflexia bacterium]|nr:hypothetical protein [Chloroflexia bacterium]